MLINDVIALLEELPRTLAAGWATWLFVGLLLSVWQRREGRRLVVHAQKPKQKSGVRAPAAGRTQARPVGTSLPASSGDAFGELEALLEPPAGTHRLPGDFALDLTALDLPEPAAPPPARVLTAPQSLP
jgi:hypothetical protein